MAMRDFMQDLMRAQKVSEFNIIHDASVAALPDQENDIFQATTMRSPKSQEDDSSQEFSGTGNLLGFRERHRRLKEALSPVTVYRWSPSSKESTISSPIAASRSLPSSLSFSDEMNHGRVDNLRSRLTQLASDSNIIQRPPGLADPI